MWEYKDATDEQLAEASARHILSYLNGDTKDQVSRHFALQAVGDCFLALEEQLKMDPADRHEIYSFCSNYQVNDKKNQEFEKLLRNTLEKCSSYNEDFMNLAFLQKVLMQSPEYLLTLRRSASLLTHSAVIYNDDYASMLESEVERVLENGCGEVNNFFEDGDACDDLVSCVKDLPPDSKIHSLIEQDKYAEAFEALIDSDYDSAKQFLYDHSEYFTDLDCAYDLAVENFNCDLEYFDIPTDGGFVEFANGIGWRNRSGAKLFDLDSGSKTDAEDLLYNMRSCDGDRTTIVKYRVGEPFLTATEYSHDAPTGTSMTIIPEAWLDDALKFKEIRESFKNNELLNDILLVKDLQASLEEKARKDPMAAMFNQTVKDELDESYYSMVDFYNNKGFEDLAYNAGLRMADTPLAVKQPKKVLAAIYELLPKGTFEKADWPCKENFEKNFRTIVEEAKKDQVVR